MDDPHDLGRFVEAQAPVFERVLRELGAGRKESHWMWFVFPQIAGLGHSPMAQRFAIASLAEAEAYAGHDLLGARLARCTDLVNRIEGRSIVSILGRPDDMKFPLVHDLVRARRHRQWPLSRGPRQVFRGPARSRSDRTTLGR